MFGTSRHAEADEKVSEEMEAEDDIITVSACM